MQSFFKGNWEGISPVDMSIEEAMTMARDSKVILSDACLRCFEIYYNLEYPRTIVSFERKTDPEFTPEEIQGLLKFLIESRFGAEDKQNDFANDEDVFNKAINTVYSLSAREAADIKSLFKHHYKLKYHRIIKNFEKKDDNDNGLGDVTQGVSSMKVQK
ncbi:hypothetical protein GCK72_003827 [Caenorhabditis remanei]|uniref:Uncharacterized protein n=1 Tax=Caenorhabditis remanei TaxID=31234 RepID=A0A6A5HAJ4_CAERE|nr:hypothetical protein GCK72_003827 [Caenorhabditis remanei]KAF1763881.1 hypothetical protein GCK72_003827 [Caenorhabditis remanei]